MKIDLNPSLSAEENAAGYYELSKEQKRKAESIKAAMLEVQKRLEKLTKKNAFTKKQEHEQLESEGAKVRKEEFRKKEWFERFRFFHTANGFLVVAGKDASQNENLVGKHAEKHELFFHANITGAAATILKIPDSQTLPLQKDKEEAAQFAASYSNAWKNAFGSVDVYSVPAAQLSKKSQGEFVSKGSFVVKGVREWFKATELGLKIGLNPQGATCVLPLNSGKKLEKEIILKPGTVSQNATAKKIAASFAIKETSPILELLPGPTDLQ